MYYSMAEMSVAEISVGRNVRGRNVHGRNVLAETSMAEMSVAEMSEHHVILFSLKCKTLKDIGRSMFFNFLYGFRPFM